MIARLPARVDLLPEPLQPGAAGGLGGARLVAAAERVRLDPEVGDEIGGDLPRELRVDLRRDALRRQHGHRGQRRGVASCARAGDGRLGPRRNAGEHEHAREGRRAGERQRAERGRRRAARTTSLQARRRAASTTGRAAQTIVSAPSSATFVQNSVVCGAISSTASERDRDGVDAAPDPAPRASSSGR